MPAGNIGESQTAPILPHQINPMPGNTDTKYWSKSRDIKTTGGTGQSRNYGHFYESSKTADAKFNDTKNKIQARKYTTS